MNEQIETAARAEAKRRWADPDRLGPARDAHKIDAFTAGATWQAAQPRTVSAEQVDAAALSILVAEQEDAELREAARRYWSSARVPDEVIERPHYRELARAVLAALGITVAEPVEHRVTTEGLYNYWCACGWRYAHVGSGEPDEVAVAKHDAYVAEAGEVR